MSKRIASSQIGEVFLDTASQLVQLRLYNMTLDLELSEWRDLIEMVKEGAKHTPKHLEEPHTLEEGSGLGELLGASLKVQICASCGEEFALFSTGGKVECPECGAVQPSKRNEDG